MKKSIRYTHLRSEPGQDLTIAKIRFDHLRNERNGAEIKVSILESPDAANVVALTPENEVLLVEQYRFGTGAITLELPGGMIDAGEEPLVGVQRELREETGYTGSDWTYLGKIASNPVFQDSYIHHFLLRNAELTHPTHFDAAEDLRLHRVPVETVWAWLRAGRIGHPHSMTALYWAREVV